MIGYRLGIAAFSAMVLISAGPTPAHGLDFPGPTPGTARGEVREGLLRLENDVLAVVWSTSAGRLTPVQIVDKMNGVVHKLDGAECFEMALWDTPRPGLRRIKASEMKLLTRPELRPLAPQPKSTRTAMRCGGKEILVRLTSPDGNLELLWRAALRDGSNYLRQHLLVQAKKKPVELKDVVLVDAGFPAAEVAGVVDGSPVVAGSLFLACEHPLSKSEVTERTPAGPKAGKGAAAAKGQQRRVRCLLPRNVLLQPGKPFRCSSVIGVVPEGQLRRGFLYYLERERAFPYHPFLHHNNGEEIGLVYWKTLKQDPEKARQLRVDQAKNWAAMIDRIGKELVERRETVIDSFVHDYTWDDPTLIWQFHEGFPEGFMPLRNKAKRYHSALGIWYSPSGGYSAKSARVKAGAEQGFELNKRGLSLAGPRYYARFRTACVEMIARYGMNYFKFDGFAAGNNQPGAGEFASDAEALIRLLGELRQAKPDVFINVTTGSWPSPYWLWHGDSIWRAGRDASTSGKGSPRQQWITYRDRETYHFVLGRAPLYPLNSLMLHGIMINSGGRVGSFEPADMIDEIRSFFGTGTNCQELYIAPQLLTEPVWDALAEAARWSRANADVLVDTHWIGGDPAESQVYGWAAWSTRKGVLTLRNPDDQPAAITLDIGQAFELPPGAPRKYTLRSPWKQHSDKPPLVLAAGAGHRFELKPFEVLVLDAEPAR